jgi:hypothetical protein
MGNVCNFHWSHNWAVEELEYRISNKEYRISKDGIARAAQALAPRVALSFYYK